jgi:hypothetical protein
MKFRQDVARQYPEQTQCREIDVGEAGCVKKSAERCKAPGRSAGGSGIDAEIVVGVVGSTLLIADAAEAVEVAADRGRHLVAGSEASDGQ